MAEILLDWTERERSRTKRRKINRLLFKVQNCPIERLSLWTWAVSFKKRGEWLGGWLRGQRGRYCCHKPGRQAHCERLKRWVFCPLSPENRTLSHRAYSQKNAGFRSSGIYPAGFQLAFDLYPPFPFKFLSYDGGMPNVCLRYFLNKSQGIFWKAG